MKGLDIGISGISPLDFHDRFMRMTDEWLEVLIIFTG